MHKQSQQKLTNIILPSHWPLRLAPHRAEHRVGGGRGPRSRGAGCRPGPTQVEWSSALVESRCRNPQHWLPRAVAGPHCERRYDPGRPRHWPSAGEGIARPTDSLQIAADGWPSKSVPSSEWPAGEPYGLMQQPTKSTIETNLQLEGPPTVSPLTLAERVTPRGRDMSGSPPVSTRTRP